MRTWTTIIDITKDMKLVDDQTLDDLTDCNDEVVSASCRDNRLDDGTDIVGLILVVSMFMEQLLDDVREVIRQRFPNLRACIFARHITTHLNQSVNGDMIPVFNILFFFLYEF